MIQLRMFIILFIARSQSSKVYDKDLHVHLNMSKGSENRLGSSIQNRFGRTRDANPGPWNWNGFPPTRGANPWQLYWNGSPNLNRGCPPGYDSKEGDIPGWGQLGGMIYTNKKGCSDRCNRNNHCCSFEYSDSWKLCNLNSDCQPSRGKYQDYVFCVKQNVRGCPPGYYSKEGHIPGWGQLGG